MSTMERHVEDRELSQAVVEYLGKGRSAFPRTDEDAVIAFAIGAEIDPTDLLVRVRAIVAECMAVEIDWSTHTLVQGGRAAQAIMDDRHPELGDDALEALYWMFTYNWR